MQSTEAEVTTKKAAATVSIMRNNGTVAYLLPVNGSNF